MPSSTRTYSSPERQTHTYPLATLTSSITSQQFYTPTNPTASSMQNTMQQNHNLSQIPQPQSLQPSYPTGGPVQPQQQPYVSLPPNVPAGRPSSGAWTPADDATLMSARAQGLNWAPIQAAYFPNKTPNACRKRHERLMDRRNSDDWDVVKLETLAKEYMGMRREIWAPLAAKTGEKWSVVEAKCMSSGLKNLQSAARACTRRERLEAGCSVSSTSTSSSNYNPHHPHNYPDDSAIGIDDLDAEYSAETTSSGYSPEADATSNDARMAAAAAAAAVGNYDHHLHAHQQYQHHQHQQRQMMQNGGRPTYGLQQRMSSSSGIDMGIGSIINRTGGGN